MNETWQVLKEIAWIFRTQVRPVKVVCACLESTNHVMIVTVVLSWRGVVDIWWVSWLICITWETNRKEIIILQSIDHLQLCKGDLVGRQVTNSYRSENSHQFYKRTLRKDNLTHKSPGVLARWYHYHSCDMTQPQLSIPYNLQEKHFLHHFINDPDGPFRALDLIILNNPKIPLPWQ